MSLLIADMSVAGTSVSAGTRMDQNQTKFSSVVSWTGTPTGTVSMQASNDSTDGVNGTWVAKPTTITGTQPAGGVGSLLVEATDVAEAWLRYAYARTSGAGALSGVENKKA